MNGPIEVKITRTSPLAESLPIPFYATEGSAAMDLLACLEEPVTLATLGRALIPTGIAIALPSPEYVALVFARSGLAIKHGITLTNAVGVIDSDYRGEIRVGVVNLSNEEYTVVPGDRIAQLGIFPVCRATLSLCSELPETGRGAGGFGSTGR